jgi:UDP-N-acetylmuramate dehydrogenase
VDIIKNFPIPNTLGLSSEAEYGCWLFDSQDVFAAKEFACSKGLQFRVIGSGSNVVPMPRVGGLVGVMSGAEISKIAEFDSEVLLQVNAGQNWHELVMYCADRDWFGIENLALIPGSVGAAPVQNIGAYGVELAEVLDSVQVIEEQQQLRWIAAEDCEFGYRRSRFQKQTEQVIVAIRLKLSTVAKPRLEYPDLANYFTDQTSISARQIADAVVTIRSAKLPDPARNPNVGSFFKNPIISQVQVAGFTQLGLSIYQTEAGAKLSAAQLIDRCGWKDQPGTRVCCWPKQPLVLINHNNAEASHILDYANDVRASVAEAFAVQLEMEPSVLS